MFKGDRPVERRDDRRDYRRDRSPRRYDGKKKTVLNLNSKFYCF